MNSEEDDTEWLWDRDKFRNRKFIMQEMYQNYVEGDEWDVPQVSLYKAHSGEGRVGGGLGPAPREYKSPVRGGERWE